MKTRVSYLGLSNYYGTLTAYEEDGKYYMFLDDNSEGTYVGISQKLFDLLREELCL